MPRCTTGIVGQYFLVRRFPSRDVLQVFNDFLYPAFYIRRKMLILQDFFPSGNRGMGKGVRVHLAGVKGRGGGAVVVTISGGH